jgi:hypothetical protein
MSSFGRRKQMADKIESLQEVCMPCVRALREYVAEAKEAHCVVKFSELQPTPYLKTNSAFSTASADVFEFATRASWKRACPATALQTN